MSTCLDRLLEARDAAEPAIAPCAAVPLVTDNQCAGMDEMGAYLDEMAESEPVDADYWWAWPLGVLVALAVAIASILIGPQPWF